MANDQDRDGEDGPETKDGAKNRQEASKKNPLQFGGASIGADQREQTADHARRGEDYRVDDAVNAGEEGRTRSRDES